MDSLKKDKIKVKLHSEVIDEKSIDSLIDAVDKKIDRTKEYEKKNSDIINEVRKSVGSKVKNLGKSESPADLKDNDLIKSIVEEWFEKMQRKLPKIFFKKIKNLFK